MSRNGGDQAGDSLRETSYTANRLNQYSSRTTPASADVIGMARGTAVTVKLNGASVGAPYRKGEYFWKNVTVRPGTSPATGTIAFDVDGTAFSGGTVTLPAQVEQTAAPANLAYDADGNLTLDSLWSYQWDAENRLVAMLRVDGSKRVEMEYDHVGRRIGKKVYSASTGGTLVLQEKYLYDGWNLVAVLDGANVLQKSFLWGTDLSGSMQGAGGVGGLIGFTKHAAPSTGTWFAAFDGNGNLGALVSAADGSVQATYEYGPFGEVIRATGANAKANPFRFSTKFQDDETDLVYYGYRFYSPVMGRWANRDPIGTRGGRNLFGFLKNAPLDTIDPTGLCSLGCGPDVTLATDMTLANVENVFRSWDDQQQGKACAKLHDVLGMNAWGDGGGSLAWDIHALKMLGKSWGDDAKDWPLEFGPKSNRGTGPICNRTVFYRGGCYYAGAVNYLLWGKMNYLCSNNVDLAAWGWVGLWKFGLALGNGRGEATLEDAQAIAFTYEGYGAINVSQLSEFSLDQCQSTGRKVAPQILSWTWRPMHNN